MPVCEKETLLLCTYMTRRLDVFFMGQPACTFSGLKTWGFRG